MRSGWGGRGSGDCAAAVLIAELPPGRYAVAVEVRFQQRVIRGCAEIPEVVFAGPRVEIDIGVVKVRMPATVDAAVSRGMLERVRLAPGCAARFVLFIAIPYPAVVVAVVRANPNECARCGRIPKVGDEIAVIVPRKSAYKRIAPHAANGVACGNYVVIYSNQAADNFVARYAAYGVTC